MGYCPRCFASTDSNTPKCPFDGATAKTTPNPDKLIGAEILSHKVVRRIGEGSSGTVYVANHRTTARPCALKVIRAEWLAHARLVERFAAEARVLAAIDHPNIVRVLAVGTLADAGVPNDKRLFVQMEYVQGATLAERLKERTRIPMLEALPIAKQICDAINAAHARQICHRDLRPRNVFLTGDDPAAPVVKILGFGSDTPPPASADATEIDVRVGVADYMPPEQLTQGAAAMTYASDLFSLGVIMFEMAAGRRPDPRRDLANRPTPRQLLEGAVARIDEYVTVPYEKVILKCVSHDPAERYSSAASLGKVLDAAREAPVQVARAKRGLGVLGASIAGMVVLLLAVTFTLGHHNKLPASVMKFSGGIFFPVEETRGPVTDNSPESHLHARASWPTANKPRPPKPQQPASPLPAEEFALPDTAPQQVQAAQGGVPQPCLIAEDIDNQSNASCVAKQAKWKACVADVAVPGHEVPGAVKTRYTKRVAALDIICQLDQLAFAPDCKQRTKELLDQAHSRGLREAESAVQDAQKGCP